MRRPGIWVAKGQPVNPTQMYSWRPGAIAGMAEHLMANDVYNYKQAHPDVPVIVRFQHPHNWLQDPTGTARKLGQTVAGKWAELKVLDPYVYFASRLNMHYENGDPNPANQPNYTTPEFYQKYANWVRTTADVIKYLAPDMKLVTPPLAFGYNEDGSPDSSGHPLQGWAGYDYLQDTIRQYFDNIITFHGYWGYPDGGSVPDWLYEPELSSWFAFRWQRLLQLFQARYGISARVIISQAGSYGLTDPDFTDQLIYYARQCLSDARVLALTYYQWADAPDSPLTPLTAWTQAVPNLEQHLARLKAMPDVSGGVPAPVDTELSGIMDFPEPAATPLPQRTIRVLFEDDTVQTMPLEEYLRASVAGEVPALWPEEALKAQAVASRTYAQYAIEHSRHQPRADICTTTHCQHYSPKDIHDRTDAAVRDTAGLILRFDGKTADTVYHARCGGHTRNNEDVWTTGRPLAYLRGVPCPDTGQKSGHGVGLCQYGARAFASQGRKFDEILKHYYQGVTIESLDK